MSFKVRFYIINKKQNSTKQPGALDTYEEYDCVLKGSCSILAPVIQLTTPKSGTSVYNAPLSYNYCYISDFHRYYFVTDWVYSGAAVIATLAVDVLASYKTAIGGQTLYVSRSASSYDGDIIDTTYPTKTDVTFLKNTFTNPFAGASGVYVVGIINRQYQQGSGTVTYYAFNPSAFKAFVGAMFTSISWMNIDVNEISEDLQKALVNPFQYVVSCMYLPVNAADITGISGIEIGSDVDFGFWTFSILPEGYAILLPQYYKSYSGMINVPKHPQAATRGTYLNSSPYSSYSLAIYPFGFINLDATDVMDAASISYTIHLDLCTGRAICNLDCGNGKLRVIESQVGITIPTTSIQIDWSNWEAGLISAGASIAGQVADAMTASPRQRYDNLMDPIRRHFDALSEAGEATTASTSMTSATGSNIGNSALAAMSKPEISGELGMQTGYATQAWDLTGKFLTLVNEDLAHRGRPLCSSVMISSLSGFVQVADGDFSISGVTAQEQNMIIGFLTSGFFYE